MIINLKLEKSTKSDQNLNNQNNFENFNVKNTNIEENFFDNQKETKYIDENNLDKEILIDDSEGSNFHEYNYNDNEITMKYNLQSKSSNNFTLSSFYIISMLCSILIFAYFSNYVSLDKDLFIHYF